MNYPSYALQPGSQVDTFDVISILGVGGFGLTYMVKDVNIDKVYAMKEMFPDSVVVRGNDGVSVLARSTEANEDFNYSRDRFISEARVLAKLDHPAIVKVHRLMEANGTCYMVMDYVEGVTLHQHLKQVGGRLRNKAEVEAILYPLVEGIDELHKLGLLHRDIKPANIMLRRDGSPVLLDFGAVTQVQHKTESVTQMVTKGYSPFEQYTSKAKQGPYTDIYALAATMVHAISGVVPEDAGDRMVSDEYIPFTQQLAYLQEYGTPLLMAIDQGMLMEMSHRPQSMGQWMDMMRAPCLTSSAASPLAPRLLTKSPPRLATPGGAQKSPPVIHPVFIKKKSRTKFYVAVTILIALIGIICVMIFGRVGETDEVLADTKTSTPPEVTEKLEDNQIANEDDKEEDEERLSSFRTKDAFYIWLMTTKWTGLNGVVIEFPNINKMKFINPNGDSTTYDITMDSVGVINWKWSTGIVERFSISDDLKTSRGATSGIWTLTKPKEEEKIESSTESEVVKENMATTELNLASDDPATRPAGTRKVFEIYPGVEMAFRWCPPTGEEGFLMGSPTNEKGRKSDEIQHRVILTKGFWMGETECTQAQWQAIMGNNPSGYNGDNLPVETVSQFDVRNYLKKVNTKKSIAAGWEYALPTEAQWEYACRAGTQTAFHYGHSITNADTNFGGNEVKINATPTQVGIYAANNWGLKDMHGNVSEWCSDWYAPYTGDTRINPIGPETGIHQVSRGGFFLAMDIYCRSAYRNNLSSRWLADDRARAKAMASWSSNTNGFRLVLKKIESREAHLAESSVSNRKPSESNLDIPENQAQPEPKLPSIIPGHAYKGGIYTWTRKEDGETVKASVKHFDTKTRQIKIFSNNKNYYTLSVDALVDADVKAIEAWWPKRLDGEVAGERRVFEIYPKVEVAFRWCPPTGERGFWIAETEFTQGQWAEVFMGQNNENPGHFKKSGGKLPIESVDFFTVEACIRRINSSQEGKFYVERKQVQGMRVKLPSKAQWQYACRAGSSSAYAGNGDLNSMGWYELNSSNITQEVGKKLPNAWGIHDMHGNVWEWCADGSTSDNKIFRSIGGGAFHSSEEYCKSLTNYSWEQTTAHRDTGFRIILETYDATN